MKRSLLFTITLSLLLTMVSLPVSAQTNLKRFKADSGVVTLGPNQVLRLTIGGADGADTLRARVRWMQYGAQGCSGTPAVCRHMVVAQGVVPIVPVGTDFVSFDVQQIGSGVRAIVESNDPNTRVVAMVFDTVTQQVISM